MVDFGISLSRMMVAAECRGEKFSPSEPSEAAWIGPSGPPGPRSRKGGAHRGLEGHFGKIFRLPDGQPEAAAGVTDSGKGEAGRKADPPAAAKDARTEIRTARAIAADGEGLVGVGV